MKKLIALLSLQLAFSQAPNKMSFQAYLTNNNGLPVAAGTYEIARSLMEINYGKKAKASA